MKNKGIITISRHLDYALRCIMPPTQEEMDKWPPEHPGHEAWLEIVAVPRAKKALKEYKEWGERQKKPRDPVDLAFERDSKDPDIK